MPGIVDEYFRLREENEGGEKSRKRVMRSRGWSEREAANAQIAQSEVRDFLTLGLLDPDTRGQYAEGLRSVSRGARGLVREIAEQPRKIAEAARHPERLGGGFRSMASAIRFPETAQPTARQEQLTPRESADRRRAETLRNAAEAQGMVRQFAANTPRALTTGPFEDKIELERQRAGARARGDQDEVRRLTQAIMAARFFGLANVAAPAGALRRVGAAGFVDEAAPAAAVARPTRQGTRAAARPVQSRELAARVAQRTAPVDTSAAGITNRVRPRGRPASVSGTPSEYAEKTYSRLLTEAEKLARESRGGRLPSGYTEELARRTGFTPESVKHRLMEIRNGDFGDTLRDRANTLGLGRSGQPNWQRAEIARLMDQGLGGTAINQRVNALREARNIPPADITTTRMIMSQVRKRRRDTGDPTAVAVPLLASAGGGLAASSEARAQDGGALEELRTEISKRETDAEFIESVSRNRTGPDVKRMQEILQGYGLYGDEGFRPDGAWGQRTTNAVKAFRDQLREVKEQEALLSTRPNESQMFWRGLGGVAIPYLAGTAGGFATRGLFSQIVPRLPNRLLTRRDLPALPPAPFSKGVSRAQRAQVTAARQAVQSEAERRATRVNEFARLGGAGNATPFVLDPGKSPGFRARTSRMKPPPANPSTWFQPDKRILPTLARNAPDIGVMSFGLGEFGLMHVWLQDAHKEVEAAREAIGQPGGKNKGNYLQLEAALDRVAQLEAWQRAGLGLAGGHALGMKLVPRARPNVALAEREVSRLNRFLASK